MVGFVEALKRQSGAKNVVINFKQGTAEAAWKKGVRFNYDAIKKAVGKSADLTFRAVSITADGQVTEHERKTALKVTGTNELFLLAGDNKVGGDGAQAKLQAAARSGRKAIIVTGKVREPGKGRDLMHPLTLVVERISDEASRN